MVATKRPKRRQGMDRRISKNEVNEINAVLKVFEDQGIELSDEVKNNLRKKLKELYWKRFIQEKRTTVAQRKMVLNGVLGAAREFRLAVESIDRGTFEALKRSTISLNSRWAREKAVDTEAIFAIIDGKGEKVARIYEKAAFIALDDLENASDSRRHPDEFRIGLTHILASIFESTGGQAGANKKFLSLCLSAFDALYNTEKDYLTTWYDSLSDDNRPKHCPLPERLYQDENSLKQGVIRDLKHPRAPFSDI
jgi:hypothetical protein